MSHHLDNFVGYGSSVNGDIMYLICHVASQNHVIEESCNFINYSSSLYVTALPRLVAIGIAVAELGSYNLIGRSP